MLADADVILTQNNHKVRLRSIQLFDWLLTGWKQERTTPPQNTKEIKVNDILMLLLDSEIDKAVNNYYSKYFTYPPSVYPYLVEIVNVERLVGSVPFIF